MGVSHVCKMLSVHLRGREQRECASTYTRQVSSFNNLGQIPFGESCIFRNKNIDILSGPFKPKHFRPTAISCNQFLIESVV